MEKYLLFTTTDDDSEMWLMGHLLFDGNQIGIDGNPPDFSDAVVVPSGKKPTDMDVIQDFKDKKMSSTVARIDIVPQTLGYGEYYPRIYRPFMRNAGRFKWLDPIKMLEVVESNYDPMNSSSCPPIPIDNYVYLKALSQLALLSEHLAKIFRTVEPEPTNLKVYGHEIRNLLIIACTEVEAQWKGILHENTLVKDRFTTNDYMKLLMPLKLAEYEIELPIFPDLLPFYPFADWDVSNPTKSLVWYHAYNATKHDREESFSQATLENAIKAVAACAILLVVQYGKRETWKSELREFFRFTKVPLWNKEEMYMISYGQNYTPKNYKF